MAWHMIVAFISPIFHQNQGNISVILILDLVFSVKHPLSLIPYPLSLIPYPLSLVPCPLSFVPCPLSLVPCPLSLVPCPLSLIPYSLYLIPYSLALIPYFLSLVPWSLTLDSWPMTLNPWPLTIDKSICQISDFQYTPFCKILMKVFLIIVVVLVMGGKQSQILVLWLIQEFEKNLKIPPISLFKIVYILNCGLSDFRRLSSPPLLDCFHFSWHFFWMAPIRGPHKMTKKCSLKRTENVDFSKSRSNNL